MPPEPMTFRRLQNNRLSIKNIDPVLEEEEMVNLTVNVDDANTNTNNTNSSDANTNNNVNPSEAETSKTSPQLQILNPESLK